MTEAQSVLVVAGDSVCSGQGLQHDDKFGVLVQRGLSATGTAVGIELLAHSGATLGESSNPSGTQVHPEVPVAWPTVADQLRASTAPKEAVSHVILSGGINDINIRTILNPLTTPDELMRKTEQHCERDLTQTLLKAAGRFPNAKIAVVAYYPILSAESDLGRVFPWLQAMGVGAPPWTVQATLFDRIVELSMLFWSYSSRAIQRAVQTANEAASGRVMYVSPLFNQSHSVFASDPWLFGLSSNFGPQDSMAEQRRAQCDLVIPSSDPIARETCYRASAGHPNQKGAAAYAAAILTAFLGDKANGA